MVVICGLFGYLQLIVELGYSITIKKLIDKYEKPRLTNGLHTDKVAQIQILLKSTVVLTG